MKLAIEETPVIVPARAKRKYEKRVAPSNKAAPLRDRFWAKVDVRGPNECWPWLAAATKEGYGFMRGGQREDGRQITVRAAKLAYELEYGPIQDGKIVMHECDNPGCCNPRHLKAGTCAQNNIDAVIRGRTKRKLTDAQVLEIVALRQNIGLPWNKRRTLKSIGAQFGVSEVTASMICSGKMYSWLTGIGAQHEQKKAA